MAVAHDLGNSCHIQTFAVLDLETTGLPHLECNKTKITELSVLAATRKHVIEAADTEEKVPRVLQKLNLCIYPNKRISLESSHITGLYNDTLAECGPFDENVFLLLDAFFRRLPQPVCIISHNGLRFDFPILQTELHRLGKELPAGILCADSLTAFRQLLGRKEVANRVSVTEKAAQLSIGLTKWDEYDGILYDLAEKIEIRCIENNDETSHLIYSNKENVSERENIEKTPSQGILQSDCPPNLKPQAAKNQSISKKVGSKVRKRLFEETNESEVEVKVLKKFRLTDVYEFLMGKAPSDSHHAEGDTLSLLQCIVAKGPEFIEWIDNNAKLFSDVPKLS